MSAIAELAPAAVPSGPRRHHWTREEYFRLAELGAFRGMQVERIRGEIIDMSPVGWPHRLAKTLVAKALEQAFATGHWVSEQGPIPTEDSDPEPDVLVIPGSPRDYTDHPSVAVLIVEVSDSSLDYDLTTKVELYAAANIPEYWVLDLVNRRLVVHRDPHLLPVGGHTYRTQLALAATDSVSPTAAPHATIRVADLLP